MKGETRHYPNCCLSANCGACGDECRNCPNYPVLLAWKRWRDETAAICVDPIWSPNRYIAQR